METSFDIKLRSVKILNFWRIFYRGNLFWILSLGPIFELLGRRILSKYGKNIEKYAQLDPSSATIHSNFFNLQQLFIRFN
jgi:hypothetical protein